MIRTGVALLVSAWAGARVPDSRTIYHSEWRNCSQLRETMMRLSSGGVDVEAVERSVADPSVCRLNFAVSGNQRRNLSSLNLPPIAAQSEYPPPLTYRSLARGAAAAQYIGGPSRVSRTSFRTLEAHSAAFDAALRVLRDSASYINELYVREGTFGTTHEGRDLKYVEVGGNNVSTHAFVVAGQHAREWIATEFGFRLVEQIADLVARCGSAGDGSLVSKLHSRRSAHCAIAEKDAFEVLLSVRLVIIPSLNPDGYAYTQSSRYWRMNREPTTGGHFGVDLNRNAYTPWWNTAPDSDKDVTLETYHGDAPFSTSEMGHLREFIESYETTHGGIDTLVSYHSYGKMILYPPGDAFHFSEVTEQYDTLPFHQRLAELWAAQMGRPAYEANLPTSSKGCGYVPQQAAAQYVAFGDTPDWVWRRPLDRGTVQRASRQIPTFTIELPPGGNCAYTNTVGFSLGREHIVKVVLENMRGLWWFVEWLREFKSRNSARVGPSGEVIEGGASDNTHDGVGGAATLRARDGSVSGGNEGPNGGALPVDNRQLAASGSHDQASRRRRDFPWGALSVNATDVVDFFPNSKRFGSAVLAEYVQSDLPW